MAAWTRAARAAAQGCRHAWQKGMPGLAGQVQGSGMAPAGLQQQMRGMAGGHHGPGVTYAGLTLHAPSVWHTAVGEGMCGLMWFWILYRAYHDGHTFIYGHAAHFEHEIHAEHAHYKHDDSHEDSHDDSSREGGVDSPAESDEQDGKNEDT